MSVAHPVVSQTVVSTLAFTLQSFFASKRASSSEGMIAFMGEANKETDENEILMRESRNAAVGNREKGTDTQISQSLLI